MKQVIPSLIIWILNAKFTGDFLAGTCSFCGMWQDFCEL